MNALGIAYNNLIYYKISPSLLSFYMFLTYSFDKTIVFSLVEKFRLKLKKVGKTTRPFRHALNQFPYEYIVEMTNRLKGLHPIDRVPEELWRFVTLYRMQWSKPFPIKRNAKRQNGWGGLTIVEERREAKGKGEKEGYTHLHAEFQRIAKRDKKAFLNDQYKQIEGNNRMGKTRDLFKKIRDTKGIFHAKMGTIKDRNGKDLTEREEIKKNW